MHFACRIALLTALSALSTYGQRGCALSWKRSTADLDAHSEHSSPLSGALANRRREFLRQLLDEYPECHLRGARAAFHSRLHRGGDRSEQRSLTEHGLESAAARQARLLKQKLDHDSELAGALGATAVTAHECAADLPERRRRARFSSTEQRARSRFISPVCASCRIAQQITAADFEELDTVDPAGRRAHRAARCARPACRGAPALASVTRRKVSFARVLGVAAALVLLVGSAFASVRLWHAKVDVTRNARTVVNAGPASEVNRAGSVSSASPIDARTPAPVPVAATNALGDVTATRATLVAPSAAPEPSVTRAADAPSAAQLLHQAGDAQRRGDRDQAATLYQKLQAQYPASAEALLSHVSLGRLLAERGQPRAALRQFERYLSEARGGVLIPEALYGRGRALTGLGDRAEETRTWQRLLRDFSDSAYTEPARRRLAELE